MLNKFPEINSLFVENVIDKQKISKKIKELAKSLGFELVGITSAEKVSDIDYYKSWVENGFAGEMDYLKRNIEKREDPELLLPGTKSIICLGLNYYQNVPEKEFKVAKYALGDDYHTFLKEKIQELFRQIKEIVPELDGKTYVDTAPVLERALAKRAGLGWIGKNTLLINPTRGSYYLLGELFLNIELEYDGAIKDYCGNCTRCIDACPTDAIISPGKLDSNLCISYLTIEAKTNIADEFTDKLAGNIFGCDICQDVCPWNKKFSVTTKLEETKPRKWLNDMALEDLLNITQEEFSRMFKDSPIKRSKLRGFLRNIIAYISSLSVNNLNNQLNSDKKYLNILEKLTIHDDNIVRNQAFQAVKKYQKKMKNDILDSMP